ncbi:VOC family protein [Micromonospora radicis]|uniref:VOC domain-containing protein n=1 Tax=Micromonospora radicis TaxID=1894971 RepID=A0A418MQ04_9ACTN|nr:VOC family protein [Micromonospora radicis]RIV34581.1 hypothetical protein D2L64_21990 [Micromonospora radicis]
MGISRIYLQTINCTDLDVSLEFYTQVFGFVDVTPERDAALQADLENNVYPALFGVDGPVAFREAYLAETEGKPGDALIHLFQWRTPAPVGRNAYPTSNHVGLVRTQFQVDDFDGVRQRLIARGAKFYADEFEWLGAGNSANPPKPSRLISALDPDGVMMQIKAR